MLESPASRSCFEISVRKTRTELRFPDLRTRFPGPSYEAVNDGLRPVRPHRRVRGSETLPRGSRTSFRGPSFEVVTDDLGLRNAVRDLGGRFGLREGGEIRRLRDCDSRFRQSRVPRLETIHRSAWRNCLENSRRCLEHSSLAPRGSRSGLL